MIVVDTSALIAVLLNEPDRPVYRAALTRTRGASLIAAPTVLEATMVAVSRRDQRMAAILDDLIGCEQVTIVPFDPAHLMFAQAAFLRYGKGRHPAGLNFGDCITYALAKSRGLPLLFKGDDFSRTDIQSALAG